MPAERTQYTLVGFSAELDWKPLNFVKPIPPNRVCHPWGLIRRKYALLPCMHVLCESCYEQCKKEELPTCPLDEYVLQDEDDVDWEEYPADQMLKREVRCSNEAAGSGAQMPASCLPEHVLNECGHHSTSCTRCSASILYSDVCAHLRSDCRSHILPGAFDGPQQPKERETLAAFERLFHKSVAEMGAGLGKLDEDSKTQVQALNEVCHGMNALRELLDEKFAEAAEQNRNSFAQNTADISRSVKDVKECLTRPGCTMNIISQNINSITQTLVNEVKLAMNQNRVKVEENGVKIADVQREIRQNNEKITCLFKDALKHYAFNTEAAPFNVTNMNTRKDTVFKRGWDEFASDPVYFRGYYMSPGMYFKENGDSVCLHIRTHLHKGAYDDVLKWPFAQTVKLTVIHPESDKTRDDTFTPNESDANDFSRPVAKNEKFKYVAKHSFLLADLEREGYVKDDKLVLKYELL